MHKFLWLLVSLGFVGAGLPANALADISLEITDGSNTHSAATPKPGFALSMPSPSTPYPPGFTATMSFLTKTSTTCTARPCIVSFPSGIQGGGFVAGVDTFLFRDACDGSGCPADPLTPASSNAARIIQTDSSVQKIELKGLQVTALPLGVGKTVKVTFSATKFNKFPPGTYPWTVTFGSLFTKKRSGTPALAVSCPDPYDPSANPNSRDPCARLRLYINGQDADTYVASPRLGPFKTVSIPCDGRFNYPCGPGGSYRTNGSFKALASGGFPWDGESVPVQKAELTDVYFNATDQTHSAINSAIAAISTRQQQDFGVEHLFYSIAKELDGNFWVYFSAASHSYFPPKEGVTLTSIVSDKLSPLEQARNSRSYASFIADPLTLQWQDVTKLKLAYDFVVGPSGGFTFSDCVKGSFYLRVALVNEDGTDATEVKIYLGSTDNFRSGCDKAAEQLNDVNLVNIKEKSANELRVAEGGSINKSQITYGKLYVRSISVVVDQGGPEPIANYKVRLYNVTVNGTRLAAGF
jgi:hypothetical protein